MVAAVIGALALAVVLTADVFYPWPIKDPEPPTSTVEPIDLPSEKGGQPTCIPQNETCDDPE